MEHYNEINSIDDASEIYKTLHENKIIGKLREDEIIEDGAHLISPEQEFWGHCSNIQTWYEHNYDTRLIHSNLAFPLLKKLSEEGDEIAKKMLKREIETRFIEGDIKVRMYLVAEDIINDLDKDLAKKLQEPLMPYGVQNLICRKLIYHNKLIN